jgi:ubiquitin-like modifier-activating enzyme ATG7
LDQQCTVTRPGLSYIASAFDVELLVSCLQHVKGGSASASDLSRLGKLPHQIRGNLAHQEVFTLSGSAFENCTCCSETILQCLEKDSTGSGFEFVKMVCNSPLELERLSGLAAIKLASEELANLSMIEPDENDDSDDF